jgi:hypothetical protein
MINYHFYGNCLKRIIFYINVISIYLRGHFDRKLPFFRMINLNEEIINKNSLLLIQEIKYISLFIVF